MSGYNALDPRITRVEKLAQVVTRGLHLRVEVSLGSTNPRYPASGVSVKEGRGGLKVIVESHDYLIVSVSQGARPETACFTHPLLPGLARLLTWGESLFDDEECFWIGEGFNSEEIWCCDKRKYSSISCKSNGLVGIYPALKEEISGGAGGPLVPGMAFVVGRKGSKTRATVVLNREELVEFRDFVADLDLTSVGLQMTLLAMSVSVSGKVGKLDEKFVSALDEKAESMKMPSIKEVQEMGEEELYSLLDESGMLLEYTPDDIEHLKEGVILALRLTE